MRTSTIKAIAFVLLFMLSLHATARLSAYEATCAELGFKKRTQAYGECVLELDRRKMILREQETTDQQEIIKRQDHAAKQQLQFYGDGSIEHKTCNRFGFVVGTTSYSDCRLKIDIAKREQAQKEAAYQLEMRRYEEEKRRYEANAAEFEREKERQKGAAMMRFGLALMGGTSPHLSENLANAGRQSMGMPPIAPTRPLIQNFTITGPDRRMTNCSVLGNNINCH